MLSPVQRRRAWLAFAGAIAFGLALWGLITYALSNPPFLVGLVIIGIFGWDLFFDHDLPFLATDAALRDLHGAPVAVSFFREYIVPSAVLWGVGWAAYQIVWLGHERGLIAFAGVWLVDLVVAWTIRDTQRWRAYRRFNRTRPAGDAMLETTTTTREGNE